jgi:hypothetical protein
VPGLSQSPAVSSMESGITVDRRKGAGRPGLEDEDGPLNTQRFLRRADVKA